MGGSHHLEILGRRFFFFFWKKFSNLSRWGTDPTSHYDWLNTRKNYAQFDKGKSRLRTIDNGALSVESNQKFITQEPTHTLAKGFFIPDLPYVFIFWNIVYSKKSVPHFKKKHLQGICSKKWIQFQVFIWPLGHKVSGENVFPSQCPL